MITEHDTEVPGIAIVRSARGWARTLHRYVVDHGGAIVRTRPLEERQALEDDYDILIVDDISSFLNNHIVDELHRRGRRVLGVYDPEEYSSNEENSGKQRLIRIGVDGVVEAQATPEEFVRVIQDLAPVKAPERTRHIDISDAADEDLLSSTAAELFARSGAGRNNGFRPAGAEDIALPPARIDGNGRRRGHITAVLGSSGGSGSTEVSIELARSLGRRGERTVLVDGDELAPSLAQRLNLALHPNIRTAVDVVEHGTGRLSECLTAIANNLECMVGIPHPKDWVEMRGSDMSAVLSELARGRPQIVVNASPSIEDLTTFGGADRFGLSRAVAAAADTIVMVCSPTPMGIARLLDRVADLATISDNKPTHVVVNRTQKGTFKRNEIAREIQRSFGPAGIHFIPADPRVERAAWEGTLVPAGEFTKAISSGLTPGIPKANFSTPRRKGAQAALKRSRH